MKLAKLAAAMASLTALIFSAAYGAMGAYDLTRSAVTYNEGWLLAFAYIVMTASCLWTGGGIVDWLTSGLTVRVQWEWPE